MATCLSRRAYPDKQAFLLFREVDGKIKEGTTIWIEYRCPNMVTEGVKICPDCASKLPKYKYQATQKCDHGMVSGPYPEGSKLYGSPYFLKKSKDGWKIKEDDERRAKEAAAVSSSNMPPRKQATEPKVDVNVEQHVATAAIKAVRKPRIAKKATEVAAPIASLPDDLPPQAAQYVESNGAPIKVTEVIVVKVKKIKCQDKDYYLDSQSGKLYGVSVNGVGPYRGRYDAEAETIDTNFPDSDEE